MKSLIILLMSLTVDVGDYVTYSEQDSCTSNFIKSIDATLSVVSETVDAYEVDLDYKFKFQFGSHSGHKVRMLDRYYFTEQFLIDLRRDKYHEGPGFSMRHDGFDGVCDYVHIYDIDDFDGTGDAKICYGQPVLGVVEMDVRGKIEGMSFKACVVMD
jgi:hypothetical protein